MSLFRLYEEHLRTLSATYEGILAAEQLDGIVVHSGRARKRTAYDDQYWPLRPTPHFHHWLAWYEPDCALVIRPGRRPKLIRPTDHGFWEKPARPLEGVHLEPFDVCEVATVDAIRNELPQGPNKRLAFVGEDASVGSAWGLSDAASPALLGRMDAARVRKTPYEVACLREANRRAARGHLAVRDAFARGGATELALHLLFLSETEQDDPDTPYKNIVALGTNAATLHHITYERRGEDREGESLLVDAGVNYLGYGSDITRTWVRGSSEPAKRFAALVAATESMQRALCRAVRIGMPYEDLHDSSHTEVGTILHDLGIVRCGAEEAVANGLTRAFFPHGLGHSLGLQTHDVGCALIAPKPENPYLRNTSPIESGQTFTVEPGIYFIDSLMRQLREGPNAWQVDWTLVRELSAFGGIRIEDDLAIDPDGAVDNLTRDVLPLGGGLV